MRVSERIKAAWKALQEPATPPPVFKPGDKVVVELIQGFHGIPPRRIEGVVERVGHNRTLDVYDVKTAEGTLHVFPGHLSAAKDV